MTLIDAHQGDCIDILPTLAPGSVQVIVTSPPFFGLRDYNLPPTDWPAVSYAPMPGLPELDVPEWRGCLGLEPTLEMYTAHLVHVFRLAREVLRDDGVLWLNLGDSYSGGGSHHGSANPGLSKSVARFGAEITNKPPGLKPKDLMLVPHRVALALQADGWYLRNDNIWWKRNAMPGSQRDRFTRDHEYVFQLTKSARYYFDQGAVRVASKPESIARVQRGWNGDGERGYPGGIQNHFKDYTGSSKALEQAKRGRTHRTVWDIPTRSFSGAHFAVFPPALPELCIEASTKPGDAVLDMFAGSGTTARAAVKLHRRAVMIELSEEYAELQARRTTVQMEMAL